MFECLQQLYFLVKLLRRRLLVFLSEHRAIKDVAPQNLSCTEWPCTRERTTHLCFVRVCNCSHNVQKKKGFWMCCTGSPAAWSVLCRMFCACNAHCRVCKLSKIWYLPLVFFFFSNSHNYMEILLKAGHFLQLLNKKTREGNGEVLLPSALLL